MPFAVGILTHTPLWVFALLAFLIWRGTQALTSRTQPVWRLLIVPLIFLLMGLSRLVIGRGHGPEPLLAWAVAAILLAWLALARHPGLLAVDRKNSSVTLPGSVIPLVRNLTVFVLQYGVAVAAALHPQPDLTVAIIGHAVSGASAGYFAGWTWALWRDYRKSPAAAPELTAVSPLPS